MRQTRTRRHFRAGALRAPWRPQPSHRPSFPSLPPASHRSPPPPARRLSQRDFPLPPFEESVLDVPVLQAGESFLGQGAENEGRRAAPIPGGHLPGPAAARRLPWKRRRAGGALPARSRRGARPRSPAFRRPVGPPLASEGRRTPLSPFWQDFFDFYLYNPLIKHQSSPSSPPLLSMPRENSGLLKESLADRHAKAGTTVAGLINATPNNLTPKRIMRSAKLWVMKLQWIRAASCFPGCWAIWE